MDYFWTWCHIDAGFSAPNGKYYIHVEYNVSTIERYGMCEEGNVEMYDQL